MDRKDVEQVVVAQVLASGDQFETPALDESAWRLMLEEGWHCLFDCVYAHRDSLPGEFLTVLRSVNWMVHFDENDWSSYLVLAHLKALDKLGADCLRANNSEAERRPLLPGAPEGMGGHEQKAK